jgi:hypothetical protein
VETSLPFDRSLSDLATRHREFLSLSWNGISPNEVGERFRSTYGRVPQVMLEVAASALAAAGFYRARWIDPLEEEVEQVATFCYPRRSDRQVMGRANLPGQPVFYTCGNACNAILEARHGEKPDSVLFRSRWEMQDDGPWRMAALVPPRRLPDLPPTLSHTVEQAIREYVQHSPDLPADIAVFLYGCVSELFLDGRYEVTSWVAHQLMHVEAAAELLIYPSLMSGDRDLCQAFHTAPVDSGRVVLSQVEELKEAPDGVRVVRLGRPEGERVHWDPMKDLRCGGGATNWGKNAP